MILFFFFFLFFKAILTVPAATDRPPPPPLLHNVIIEGVVPIQRRRLYCCCCYNMVVGHCRKGVDDWHWLPYIIITLPMERREQRELQLVIDLQSVRVLFSTSIVTRLLSLSLTPVATF
jgi:hypothetical protein